MPHLYIPSKPPQGFWNDGNGNIFTRKARRIRTLAEPFGTKGAAPPFTCRFWKKSVFRSVSAWPRLLSSEQSKGHPIGKHRATGRKKGDAWSVWTEPDIIGICVDRKYLPPAGIDHTRHIFIKRSVGRNG